MPRHVMKCRVCGAEYEACTSIKAGGPFNWREVACSPECGEIYLARVNEARNPKKEEAEIKQEEFTEQENTYAPAATFRGVFAKESDTPEYE